MSLDLTVKIIGMALAGIPLGVVLTVSIYMVLGAANDDVVIKSLVMLGTSMFLVGLIILALAYFTDILALI